jgi:DNA-binding response OmpR family regulator
VTEPIDRSATILLLMPTEDLERVRARLVEDGFDVLGATDESSALEFAGGSPPDAAVVDLAQPLFDGLETVRHLRAGFDAPDLPVVLILVEADDSHRVIALEQGADDCMARPPNERVLVARLRALLRRTVWRDEQRVLRAGAVVLDLDRFRATLAGRELRLTTKEFELLKMLMQARGRVVRREAILERVWAYDPHAEIESRTLDVHIRRLRQKLGPREGARIRTLRNIGYRFDPDPAWSARIERPIEI